MAYNELIGHFSRVRAFMQHFYVYGFYTREEFSGVSSRAYDDERRRVEGWLGEYMGFRRKEQSKSVFLSLDSREFRINPLYRAFRAKSFTSRDITLHFLLLDLLADGEARTVPEMMALAHDGRLEQTAMAVDLSTLRGKAREMETLGLITAEKRGKFVYFRRAPDTDVSALAPMLAFFAQTAPCGVVGSYLEDRLPAPCDAFRMKHHYITGAMDSDVLCQLLTAMRERRYVTVMHLGRRTNRELNTDALPLYILRSVQDGRSYLAAWCPRERIYRHWRLGRLLKAVPGPLAEDFAMRRERYHEVSRYCWGTSLRRGNVVQRVSFTLRVEPWEEHVVRRLQREKRCGTVTQVDETHWRFETEVFDASEMMPWVRSFMGRISSFTCSDRGVERRFRRDVRAMYRLYHEEPSQERDAYIHAVRARLPLEESAPVPPKEDAT